MMAEAARVGEQFHSGARSLFARTPLGWDFDTIDAIYHWFVSLPGRLPEILAEIREQGRLLGFAGSGFMLALIPLLLKKRTLLSLLPDLPYLMYQRFVRILDRYYFPVVFFTFLTGLLWCFGYREFSKTLWIKTWAVAGAFVLIMIAYHRATKVRTRDNVEYLIPNADFINKTFVNFTLSSPMIRIHIPVRVSYRSDTDKVRRILVETAGRHEEVLEYREPEVSFASCGHSGIDFELLVWVDIRKTAEWRIRSRLYFDIFEAFRRAGIEIPVPQRDVYIRSGAPEPALQGS